MEPICHPDVHLQPGTERNESSTRKGILLHFWSHCLTPWTEKPLMHEEEQDREEYKQKKKEEYGNIAAKSMTDLSILKTGVWGDHWVQTSKQ